MKIAGAQHPLDQPEEEGRAELVLDQAGQPDRDDEEEADREQQREDDRQAPDPAADLLLLALLVLLQLRVGGDRQRLEADLHRLAEGDDAADHRQPPERGGAGPRGRAARTRSRSGPRACAPRPPRPRRRASSRPRAPPGRRPARRAWRPGRRRACAAGPPPLAEETCGCLCRARRRAHGLLPGPGAWRRGAGSARRGRRCRPASACPCRTGGTRSRARRAGRPWSTACRTGCRTSSARWQACTRGGFLPSSLLQSRERGQAAADTTLCGDVEPRHRQTSRRRAPCARRSGVVLFGGTAARRPPRLARDRRRRARLDFVNGPLYDAVVVSAGLACLLKARGAGRERGAWLAIGRRGPLLGRLGDLLDRVPRRRPLAPLPLAGRRRLPRLLPAGRDRASSCWSAPGPASWTGGCGWTALIAALGTAALGAAFDLRVRRRPHQRHRRPGRDHPRLPARRHPDAGPGRRRRRPDPLAARAGPGRCCCSASRRWSSPTSPTPCRRPTPACRAATGSNRSTCSPPSASAPRPGSRGPTRSSPMARFDGWRELMVPAFFAAVMIALFAMQYFSRASGLTDGALGGDDDRRDRPPRRSACARTSACWSRCGPTT